MRGKIYPVSMLELALQISNEFGFSIFPCREKTQGNKKAKSPYTNRGYKDASSDEEQIRSWWRHFPNAMVGVPTGRDNGIFVVDIDVGPDKDGETSFNELGIGDPYTCQTITMSGGRHLIFAYPAEYELKNTAGALGKDIDTRGMAVTSFGLAPPQQKVLILIERGLAQKSGSTISLLPYSNN